MKSTKSNHWWTSIINNLRRGAVVIFIASGPVTWAVAQEVPKIVSTIPANGATDIDPGLTQISVTFDQDMAGGMSWTGGGPEFPNIPAGTRGHWVDKRTCVLPVKLQPGHQYRVGINSPSFRNFQSKAGVAAAMTAITFNTSGKPGATKTKVPRIVALSPRNGTNNVSPDLKELRVTFDVPMGEGCSWTGGGPDFPTIPEGRQPYWSDDQKTCILPVDLKPNHQYLLGLNSPSYKNFQSAEGVPLPPVKYTFKTGAN